MIPGCSNASWAMVSHAIEKAARERAYEPWVSIGPFIARDTDQYSS